MQKIDNGRVCFYDVDETLIRWDSHGEPEVIYIDGYPLLPNQEIINSLQRNKIRGFTIIVWSQSGCDWAEKVVRKLNLDNIVDFVMSKPERYYDDYSCDKWMGKWKDSNNYKPGWTR